MSVHVGEAQNGNRKIQKELDGLSEEELERVREYEKTNSNRNTLLETLDREL